MASRRKDVGRMFVDQREETERSGIARARPLRRFSDDD